MFDSVGAIDPRHLGVNTLAPPVYIEQMTADGTPYDESNGVRLPAAGRDLLSDFPALNLAMPEPVRFRVIAGNNSAARVSWWSRLFGLFLTAPLLLAICPRALALNPSSDISRYAHTSERVRSGVWNQRRDALAFTISPASYLTWWFAVVSGAAVCGLLAAAYTARRRRLRRVRATEARFRTFVDFTTDALIIHGKDGTIVDVNRQACDALGYSRAELIGNTPLDFDVDLTPEKMRELHQRVRSGKVVLFETRHRRKDGTIFPVEVHVRGFRQGSRLMAIALSRDITERRRAEQEHRDVEAKRFEAALEARVVERIRIARELHDTLLQSFQGLLLQFESVLNLLPARPDEARTRLISALDRATEAVTEARDAIQDLRSPAHANKDLLETIRSVADEFTGVAGRAISFSIEVVGVRRGKNPLVRDEIARISGEALRNAFRHAHANRISVGITYGDDLFHVEVRDDGKGTDLSAGLQPKPGHFGWQSMRERAEAIGGTLDITSAPGSGTTIALHVPASLAYASTAAPLRGAAL
jgi:PAS domain S-box-containing protein